MIETALRAYLLAQPAIAGAIGNRLYPVQRPQGSGLPAVTYQRVAGTSGFTHQGPDGLGRGRIQFDVWAPTYAAVVDLAEKVRTALADFGARIVNVIDVPEPEVAVTRRMVEVALWYQE